MNYLLSEIFPTATEYLEIKGNTHICLFKYHNNILLLDLILKFLD